MMQAIIRDERPEDVRAIYDLTKRAFAPMHFAGGNEQDLIGMVRDAGALSISLMAEIESRVVGHAAFTPATAADHTPGWFGLGPVAVEPALQRKGIGQQLINEGLRRLRAWNAAGCIVVGDHSNDSGLELTQSVKGPSSALSGTFSHARAREKALNDYGLRPFAAREWEKVAEGRMRALA